MPPNEGLAVVLSNIHGYGVVATRRFVAGDVVTRGDGVLYRASDDFDDTYALVLDCATGGPEFAADYAADPDAVFFYDLVDQTRWINHSCDPNTRVDGRWDPEVGMIVTWWTALRDIEPGEEITYDYAFTAEVAERCACGSSKCRGLIVDPDEVDDVDDALKPHLKPAARAAS